MLSLRKFSADTIRNYCKFQSTLAFTYPNVGATATKPPTGYAVDHTRAELGQGEAIFRTATNALRRWRQFELGWVEARPNDTSISVGETVAVLIRTFGVWSLNAARIVYVVDEQAGPIHRFGFAYGTLPGHAESGEERFRVEWNQATDVVFYDILAFSRPRHVLARIGRRQVRRLQKRFARESAAAMVRASQGAQPVSFQQVSPH
jgi:uncharacterized protein (UPF0548 family)